MNDYILAIGLNIGDTELDNQLDLTLYTLCTNFHIKDLVIFGSGARGKNDEYVYERCVQVRVTPYITTPLSIGQHLKNICQNLCQDSIAFIDPESSSIWSLVNQNGEVTKGSPTQYFPIRV